MIKIEYINGKIEESQAKAWYPICDEHFIHLVDFENDKEITIKTVITQNIISIEEMR